MTDILLVALILVALLNSVGIAVVIFLSLFRSPSRDSPQVERLLRDELRAGRDESAAAARALREEVMAGLKSTTGSVVQGQTAVGQAQMQQLQAFAQQLSEFTSSNEAQADALRNTVETRLQVLQDTNEARLAQIQHAGMEQLGAVTQQLNGLIAANQSGAEALRAAVESRLQALQESNDKRLEQIQHTVDERLEQTLERRLGQSFTLVSERLEAVQRGLGEMQALATGVGDLKRVLTNVKARGTWGEIQLGALLEQMLTPDQYSRNVHPRPDAGDVVEFAVKLPGHEDCATSCVWIPIDAKFPKEDYERLLAAAEAADTEGVQAATAALARAVRKQAKDISDKYICPPYTTDFGIMFLPTEGLYAEVLRQPGLVDDLQQTYRVVVSGPTTLAALLTSLRVGFRTLAIEKHSAEVWQVLSAVKTEFAKFGEVLDKVRKHLTSATKSIDDTGRRTRAMAKTLKQVEELPSDTSAILLELPALEEAEEPAEPEPEEA